MSVSSKELDSRQGVLDGLEEYISQCQESITAMMDELDWTPEHFMQPRKMSKCRYNSGHRMPESSLAEHERKCQLRSQNYSKEETEQILEDISYYYENTDCVYSIKLDKDTLNSLLWKHHVENHSVFYGLEKMPQTPIEEEQLLSREDRLGLAKHIIAMAKESDRLKDLEKSELLGAGSLTDLIKKEDGKDTKMNPLEEIAALRDYRRRRQTYRAKNVHITKKSPTEILREVINNQMEIYTKSLQGDTDTVNPEESVRERRNNKTEEIDSRAGHRSQSREKIMESRSSSRSRLKNETESRSDSRRERKRSRSRSEDRAQKHRSHDRARSRSKSASRGSDRHKKHKHKKHKKHKHKHKHSDEEGDRDSSSL